MNYDSLFEHFIVQSQTKFSGWDFSFVHGTGRITTEPVPWSYASKIIPLMAQADSMLDMGTGGGELLSQLVPLPPFTCATEAYGPNVTIAQTRLEPIGVKVCPLVDDAVLPFEDKRFSLIINKHEAFQPSEVRRILRDGGQFITQQVGGEDCQELNQLLGMPKGEYHDWNLRKAVLELEESGFSILDQKEYFPFQRFHDIGALIYYVKAIPWQFQDFSVDAYRDELYRLHLKIQEKGYVEVKSHRFIICAVAPFFRYPF
ncbi:SAM-dependent methyltransferase [Brevibacillus laterosporus]|uniref:SAM-dependent methyltransferase n=1 Tax=Brevibacillus laterosporus TaxID=1465 RepID=A0A518VA69_BRELA|nr:SAM-dependent methyltransferase [Brevibacillus laterosporus]